MQFLEKETKIYKSYIVSICLIVALALSSVFLGLTIRMRTMIMAELISHTRAYFETIVATRSWNANYGGVYVEKKAGVQSNPYYPHPDVETKDGRTFTIRNPAMMTREVSEYIGKDKSFSFHITSKQLINPNNKPDAFESRALDELSRGKKETYEIEVRGKRKYFRYMGALYINKECLKCHAHQGYKVGDVRGGISVNFDFEDVSNKLRSNAIIMLLFAFTTMGLLIAVLWLLARRLMRNVAEIRLQIQEMAITDMLTGLYNRRFLMERFTEEIGRAGRLQKKLGCLLLDIDHFKMINDTHGHQVGDEVLKEVAQRIKSMTRNYDILARYGGEEFMIVLPDTDLQNAVTMAERIAQNIRKTPINDIAVTISAGISTYDSTDKNIDDMIKKADKQLYAAKAAGRDRVKWNKDG